MNKLLLAIVRYGLFVFLLAMSVPAQAQSFIGTNTEGQLGFSATDLLQTASMINTFMHIVILIVLNFAQYLLQSDFFTNPAMMSAMNNVWRLSRDIMNIVFAIMLIGVALYTIVTANKKFVTEKLQTFVMAVILVNFSWFFPRVIVDVANILTATIYTVPQFMTSATCETFDDNSPTGKKPCEVIVDVQILDGNPALANPVTGQPFCPGGVTSATCACNTNIGCYKLGQYNSIASANAMGVGHLMINGLVVNFAKVLELVKIPQSLAGPGAGTAKGFTVDMQIIMSVLFALMIQFAVVLPLIGLTIGLLIRIVILWVTIAFMPFTFLGYVINGKLGTNVFGFEVNVWDEFVTAAFLPAMVALPISIGFVMLLTVVNVPAPAGEFPLTFGRPILYGVKSWWAMLWIAAAIGILWTGAFAALARSKITGRFTEKIRSFGENIFGAALQVPLIVPLPLPGKGNLGTILNAPRIAADAIRTVASGTSGRTVRELLPPSLGGTAGKAGSPGAAATDPTKISKTAADLRADADNAEKIVKAIDNLKSGTIGQQQFLQDEAIRKIAEKLGPGATAKDVLVHLEGVSQTNEVATLIPKIKDIKDLVIQASNGSLKP